MRRGIIIARVVIMAAAAIVVFGLITLPIQSLDHKMAWTLPAWFRIAGLVLLAAGGVLLVACFYLFAVDGALTPGPAFPDPPMFVSRGPYKFVRNPMTKGLFTVLSGWGFYLRSPAFLVFALMVAIGMHLLIVYVEEPKLARRFGQSYITYRNHVGRWIPRWDSLTSSRS